MWISVSHINAYPMPCIDDLIDGLGNAKFISSLDLTRAWLFVDACCGEGST